MASEPKPSKVPPHEFDEDTTVPPDHLGRRFCRCGLQGHDGDERHPTGAQPLVSTTLPPTPEPAREFDTRRLGERQDEAA